MQNKHALPKSIIAIPDLAGFPAAATATAYASCCHLATCPPAYHHIKAIATTAAILLVATDILADIAMIAIATTPELSCDCCHNHTATI